MLYAEVNDGSTKLYMSSYWIEANSPVAAYNYARSLNVLLTATDERNSLGRIDIRGNGACPLAYILATAPTLQDLQLIHEDVLSTVSWLSSIYPHINTRPFSKAELDEAVTGVQHG